MKTTALRFSAIDTWFFRESRPMEALGGSELASLFPPPPRTLLGAVRTAIGDAQGVDWKAFATDSAHPLRKIIGHGDDLGPLRLSGPWLNLNDVRLYPVPLFLLAKEKEKDFTRLRIGASETTCLGQVRLPELPPAKQGYKPLERAWITGNGLRRLLAGDIPSPDDICPAKALFEEEPRLGIARDNSLRTAADGMLYQTRHLRPKPGLAIEAEIALHVGVKPPEGLVRLGGEGRLAHLAAAAAQHLPEVPKPGGETRGIILVLLTPARFREGWLLPGFSPDELQGTRVWKGALHGIGLTLHAAVLGKAQREGGWDMANHRPRPAQNLIPAGSAYYLNVDGGDLATAIDQLHGKTIGEDQELGRGLVACGLWNSSEYEIDTPKESS
ncbi:MAG: type III-B CRISPR module-associated protein Cmr3 [Gammaproteobacteria bacterium]|nr:type III-B CRISPR module-associated protein Cmr3 [Gammaproteobacteria bacterium]MBU1655931.1 type III-B CRISPR module-associated protein Cmr3 [Gammaproteobacteria bacterium]MBU1961803.1 type III-B CRISPR module-associated protein Cmr3 [Gammaproteobacteria bacterium]